MAVAEEGRNVEFIGLCWLRMRGAGAGEETDLWLVLRGSVLRHDGPGLGGLELWIEATVARVRLGRIGRGRIGIDWIG
jgi:hypothetical protein